MLTLILFLFFEKGEIKKIEEVLSYKYLKIEDLDFEKDKSIFTHLKDSLSLEFMKDPLKLPEFSKNIYEKFNEEEDKIIEKTVGFKIKKGEFFEILGKEIKRLSKLKEEIKNSLKNIEKEKIDTFLYNLPLIFTDENDKKDDTLYAVFEKKKIKGKKWDEKKLSKYLLKVDRKKLFKPLNSAFESLLNISFSLLNSKELKDTSFKTELGYVVINLKKENNIYRGDSFFIIFDLYGDDKYTGRVGTSNLFYSIPFSIIIDKNGNDFYDSDKFLSINSSFFGVSIGFDLEGDDIRRGKMHSISSAMFGISFLLDKKGDDTYISDFFSQCASFFGKSFLFDLGGNDVYKLTEYGQGFSGTQGYSILFDKSGNDSYIAYGKHPHVPLLPDETRSFAQGFSIGIRPHLGGGVAILIDKEGNDVYYSEVYGQGCAYFYSTGILIDGKGNDLYHLAEYGQGAGIHLANGGLFDLEGDDEYISRFGPAQGEGHDYSVGILYDKKGNDTYKVSGGQGIGLNTSVGIFIDSEGNDLYVTTEKNYGQGSAKISRGKIGIGVFIDLKGKDLYKSESKSDEPYIWTQNISGFGYDLDTIKVTYPEEEGIEMEIPKDLPIDSLFKIASKWGVGKYKKLVPKARKMLAERKDEAVDYIIKNKMNTLSPLELRAIKVVFRKNKEITAQKLKDVLHSQNDTFKINAIYLIGESKIDLLEDELLTLLKKEKKEYIKSRIIYTLGQLKTKKYNEIYPYIDSEEKEIKIAVLRCARKIKKKDFLMKLTKLLKDKDPQIRFLTEIVLRENADSLKDFLIDKIKKTNNEMELYHLLSALRGVKSKENKIKAVFLKFLKSKNPKIRAASIYGLLKYKEEPGIKNELLKLLSFEEDSYIIWILKSSL